jgi:ABC-type transport system involved in cytochrome bd biosynthesis fused ATPase/permease subunit
MAVLTMQLNSIVIMNLVAYGGAALGILLAVKSFLRGGIGLARAFLHNAPFLLLDEPTSNLDSLNEAAILKSLKEASSGKTVVLVSHRKSTVHIADSVISMERGRLS